MRTVEITEAFVDAARFVEGGPTTQMHWDTKTTGFILRLHGRMAVFAIQLSLFYPAFSRICIGTCLRLAGALVPHNLPRTSPESHRYI